MTDLLSRAELVSYFRTEEYADEIADIISNFPPAEHMHDDAQGPFESREDLAKVIAYELEDGSFHGARVTGPHLDNYHIYGHVNLLALAGAILRRAQLPAAPVETGCTSSDGGGESRPASTEPQASASRRPQGLIGEAGVAPSPSDPQCSAGNGEEWNPTIEQVNSACMWYRHDFGLLPPDKAAEVRTEARMWLRAWQKEVAGLRAVPQSLGNAVLETTSNMTAAVENLSRHQEQCDMDGVMVKVSRQALDEVLSGVEAINSFACAVSRPESK